MENPRTITGSPVVIYHKDDKYIYGAWFDQHSQWYPQRWHEHGRVHPDDAGKPVKCSLDLYVA